MFNLHIARMFLAIKRGYISSHMVLHDVRSVPM